MKKLILLIFGFLVVFFFMPYNFQKDLKIKIANTYINTLNLKQRPDYNYLKEDQEALMPWDTVFVNFLDDKNIHHSSLNIAKDNEYDVVIWHGVMERNPSSQNATILIDVIQFGFYTEADVEIFAWEGSRWYKEKYICVLFFWIYVDREIIGMA